MITNKGVKNMKKLTRAEMTKLINEAKISWSQEWKVIQEKLDALILDASMAATTNPDLKKAFSAMKKVVNDLSGRVKLQLEIFPSNRIFAFIKRIFGF
jgi:hypothetical protein